MQKVYCERLCKSVRDYFASYVGYWERQARKIEKEHAGEDMQSQMNRIAAFEVLAKEQANRDRLTGLPSLEKWARKVGVTPSTVSRWRREYAEFDEACRDCQAIQTDILRDGGLGGIYSSRVVTFLLKMNEERERMEAAEDAAPRLEDVLDLEDDGEDTS